MSDFTRCCGLESRDAAVEEPDAEADRAPVHHDPRPRARLRQDRRGSGAVAAARTRLRPHHLVAGDRAAVPPVHGHRTGPAGARRVGQAARGLHARRLRQRDARPARGAGHRSGDRGRAQLRWRVCLPNDI